MLVRKNMVTSELNLKNDGNEKREKSNKGIRRLELSVLMALIFCAAVSFLSFDGQCEEIRTSVLRLHVLANSDSQEDQSLKLYVRDRLLSEAGDMFSESGSLQNAEMLVQENLPRLTEIARQEIRDRGYSYDVEIRLEDSYFETRTYGDVTLPAGNYRALRVLIGEGEGQNWWCVLFPPLCISPATGGEEVKMDDVLTSGQMSIVEDEGYEVRFKAVEIFEDAKRLLSKNNTKSD